MSSVDLLLDSNAIYWNDLCLSYQAVMQSAVKKKRNIQTLKSKIDNNNHFSSSPFLLALQSVKRHDATHGRGARHTEPGGAEFSSSFKKCSASSPPGPVGKVCGGVVDDATVVE